MRLFLLAFLFTYPILLLGQFHQSVYPALSGQELLDAVVNDFKPGAVLNEGNARDTLYAVIYNQNDSLSCVYTQYTIFLNPALDPSQAAFAQDINLEHTYPKSLVIDAPFSESDMHHLYPSRVDVNNQRGNSPFAEIDDELTQKWYYLDQSMGSVPSENIDWYSEAIFQEAFEPREDHKGNVARAMFYFYTMYRDAADDADPDFFESQRTTLCDWHYADPVDALEWQRTFLIAGYQDGKPNPFVLDCSLSSRTYCQDQPGECPLVSADAVHSKPPKFRIFPNPAIDEITLATGLSRPTAVSITVTDLLGREWMRMEEEAYGERTLEVHGLPKGAYLLTVRIGQAVHSELFFKQ